MLKYIIAAVRSPEATFQSLLAKLEDGKITKDHQSLDDYRSRKN